MVTQKVLLEYLNQLLKLENFSDYGPNGLQVDGKKEIRKIISGVSICQPLIDAAIEKKADAILVHHGLFWQKTEMRVIGIMKNRLKALLENEINLIGYHLPLDGHATLGNNAQLAKLFGIEVDVSMPNGEMIFVGHLKMPKLGDAFAQEVAKKLNREPLYISGDSKEIKTIAWCSGGGADYIQLAVDHGVDAYLTGEIYERTVPVARENGLHLFGAGHHATERGGIQALSKRLADHFKISVEFIDIDNPV